MNELEARLSEAAGARHRIIATDGVFSMDGHFAKLDQICELADRHNALVMVDDSHAVGFIGATGRGTPELHGVADRVDILTGTLGKAMGGASGGYIAAGREIVDLCANGPGRTSSRTASPHLLREPHFAPSSWWRRLMSSVRNCKPTRRTSVPA